MVQCSDFLKNQEMERNEHLENRQLHHVNSTRKQLSNLLGNHEKNRKMFSLTLKKRPPLWKHALTATTFSLGVWMMSHVAMNYEAYAQIATFKAKTLTASVIDAFSSESPEFESLEKVQTTEKVSHKNLTRETFKNMKIYPSDNRVVFERIGKNVPLVSVRNHQNWFQLEDNIQRGLENGVVVHPVSHAPGTFGNFFLTGHSSYYANNPGRYKEVFALLGELHEGDTVKVYWEGKEYVYKMRQKRIIDPTETSVLNQPEDKSILTAMTCWPTGTSKYRLIWTADLVETN